MNLEEYKGVYVFAQQVDNIVNSIAFELIGKGKDLADDLGTEVTAVLVGSGVKGLADELAEYGADRVIVVDDPELKEYRTEPYAHALASVIEKYKPEIFLVGATAIGRDLGPRVSGPIPPPTARPPARKSGRTRTVRWTSSWLAWEPGGPSPARGST